MTMQKMLTSLRSVRAQAPSLISSNHLQATRKARGVRYLQTVRDSSGDKMSQKKEHESKTGDTMASFGEGYATRSDEEGFGGTYGGNQQLSKDDDKPVQGKDTGTNKFDHSQGSEVKEKEKARNQP